MRGPDQPYGNGMDLRVSLSFPAPPDQVAAMLTDPAFQEKLCSRSGRGSANVRRHEERTHVRTTRTVSTASFPDFVRHLVGDVLEIEQRTVWRPADARGYRRGEVTVRIDGKPLRLSAVATMEPDGDSTVVTYDGKLTASVPFIGGRIEKAAGPVIRSALEAEESLGRQWLTQDPG